MLGAFQTEIGSLQQPPSVFVKMQVLMRTWEKAPESPSITGTAVEPVSGSKAPETRTSLFWKVFTVKQGS